MKKGKLKVKLPFKITIKKIVILLVIIGAIAASVLAGNVPVEVERDIVKVGNVSDYVEEIGELTTKNEVIDKSKVNGILKTIAIDTGDMVEVGEIVAILDTTDLEFEIKSLRAQIRGVNAELANATKSIDEERLEQLNSNIKVAQNSEIGAKEIYETSQILFESGAISKYELDTAKLAYEDAAERLKIATNERALGIKSVSSKVREQYKSRVDALIYTLEIKKRQLENSSIKASTSGIITNRFVEIGDMVVTGSKIVEINDKSSYLVKTDILAADAQKIDVGTKVVLIDSETEKEYIGKISKKFPKAISKVSELGIEQKRVDIEIEPENLDAAILGYEYDLEIIIDEVDDALIIRHNSIFKIDEKNNVFVIEGEKIHLREVETGLEGFYFVEVKSGLSENEEVVLSPGTELEEGINVK